MSSTVKGMLLAAANVWAVALVVGAFDLWGAARGSNDVMFIIAILGLGPGLAIGAICGYIAGELPVFRRLTLCAIGVASVLGLGAITEPSLIVKAIPTTVILTLVLERWARPDVQITVLPDTQPSPIWLGLWLGMLNAIIVGLVVALWQPTYDDGQSHHHGGLAILMGCLGILPGAGIGAALGCFTKAVRDYQPPVRVLLIGLLALVAVAIFVAGTMSIMLHSPQEPFALIPPAMVPTMISVLILERRTRPPERMPAARALA
jgi:hypothetical protein